MGAVPFSVEFVPLRTVEFVTEASAPVRKRRAMRAQSAKTKVAERADILASEIDYR